MWIPLLFSSVMAQGSSCENLEPFCAGNEALVFENSNFENSSQLNGPEGPDYGCLLSQPYPAWFYLQVEEDGDLGFTISQFQNADGSGNAYDVDFVVWGPFERTDDYCADEALSADNIVDCSYEVFTEEQMSITGAETGDIYVVLITNWESQPGYISLQQTNSDNDGAGSTDCTILDSTLGDDLILCGETETSLDGTTNGATAYEWYVFDEEEEQYELIPGEEEATLTVSETGNYKVVVSDALNEETDEDDINVSFYPEPVASSPDALLVCSNATSVNLKNLDKQILADVDETETYRVNYYETQEDYEEENPINSPEDFELNDEDQLFAAVEGESSACISDLVSVEFNYIGDNEYGLEETTVVCVTPNGNLEAPFSIGEDLGGDFEYEWWVDGQIVSTNPVLNITSLPETLEVSLVLTDVKADCQQEFSSELQIYSPPESIEVDVEGDGLDRPFRVSVVASGGVNPDEGYEYRVDEGAWQNSNIFNTIPFGVHTISVRDLKACGVTVSEEFDLVGYPQFFTPNTDGYNDSWHIQSDSRIRVLSLHVFDRYGKLLKQLKPDGAGWDGTHGNRDLPSDDYWFKLEYEDIETGEQRVFKSHFTLKR